MAEVGQSVEEDDDIHFGLAQPGIAMFQRNIAHMAKMMRRVVVEDQDGRDHIGYLAGLDDEWIELCLEKNVQQFLIHLDEVKSVTGTDQTVADLEETGDPTAPAIRRRVEHFAQKSKAKLDKDLARKYAQKRRTEA